MRDIVLEPDPVGEADRQRAGRKTLGRRHQLAPDSAAALAIQHLAGAQIAFGDRRDVAAEIMRLPGWLLAQRG